MDWSLIRTEINVVAWIILLLVADILLPAARKGALWVLTLLGIGSAAACHFAPTTDA